MAETTQVIPALGTVLQMKKDGDATYTNVGGLLSIQFPQSETEKIDTGTLGTGQFMTSRPGRTDPGTVTFNLRYDMTDATHAYLRGLATDPKILTWRVLAPTTPPQGEQFDGWLQSCNPAAEGADSNYEAAVMIVVTGPFTSYTETGGGGGGGGGG